VNVGDDEVVGVADNEGDNDVDCVTVRLGLAVSDGDVLCVDDGDDVALLETLVDNVADDETELLTELEGDTEAVWVIEIETL
jgi:hypothetical protein